MNSYMDASMEFTDLSKKLRQEPSSRGANDTKPRITTDIVTSRRHLGHDVVELVQDSPGSVDHDDAIVGEPTALPVDEDHTQLPFEPRDVAADV